MLLMKFNFIFSSTQKWKINYISDRIEWKLINFPPWKFMNNEYHVTIFYLKQHKTKREKKNTKSIKTCFYFAILLKCTSMNSRLIEMDFAFHEISQRCAKGRTEKNFPSN